jgi:hypothetical protein
MVLSHKIGLARREIRDCRSLASNVDHKVTRLIEVRRTTPRRLVDGALCRLPIAGAHRAQHGSR